MSMSVVYSAPLVAITGEDEIAAGDVLVRDVDSRYRRSTESARIALGNRRSSGVALTAGNERSGVVLAVTGPIPATLTGLGDGAEGWVRTSTIGRMERVESPSADDDVIGWCDSAGNITALMPTGPGAISGLQGIVNVRSFGARGNGTTNDSAAFAAAITAAGDGVVWVPPGTYRLASNLVIRRRVHIRGAGGIGTSDTNPSQVSTSVLCPDAGRQIVLDSATTSGGNGSAVGSVFEDIAIRQHASEASNTDVVDVNARASWFRCTIYGDSGGRHGWAVIDGNHENTRNTWVDCHVTGTGGDGWHLLVGNSSIIGGSAISCAGKGVYIANVFGCLVSGTRLIDCNPSGIAFQMTGAPGSEDAQGQHIAVGCGVSGGNGEIYIGAAAMWVGGPSTAGLTTSSLGQYRPSGDYWSPVKVKNSRTAYPIESHVGVASTSQIAWQWQSGDDPYAFFIQYDQTGGAQRWMCRYEANGLGAYELTANGHAEGAGNLLLPRGMVLGPGGSRRIMTYGSAAPTTNSPRSSGLWLAGDVVWNDRSSNTTVSYWTCTTTGDGDEAVWTPHNL